MPKTEIPRKKGVKQFKPFRIPKRDEMTTPFSYIGGKFILTEPFETQDYIKENGGIKISPFQEDRQILEFKTVIDPEGNGDFKNLEDAIAAGFKNFFVRSGTYTFTGDIILPEDCNIIGENWDDTIFSMSVYSIIINNDDIVLENIKVVWSTNGSTAVIRGSGDDFLIRHCRFSYTGASSSAKAINLTGTDCRIIDNELTAGSLGYAIDCTGDSLWILDNNIKGSDTRITGGFNYFRNNTVTAPAIIALETTGINCLISNNYFQKASANGTYTIQVTGNGTVVTGNNLNTFGGTAGILVDANYGVIVSNNFLLNTVGVGILLNIGATGNAYTKVIGNVVYSPGTDGIYIFAGKNIIINSNSVYDAGDKGIETQALVTFTDLIITDNITSGCVDDGFNLNVQYSVINNNQANNNGAWGFEITHNYSTIIGNVCHNNTSGCMNETNGGSSIVIDFNTVYFPTPITHKTTRIINTDSPYTILPTDEVIFADTDGGAITVNLPAGVEGTNFKIINCGSAGNDLTVDPNGTEQLYNGGAGVSFDLIDAEIINIHYNATEGWW